MRRWVVFPVFSALVFSSCVFWEGAQESLDKGEFGPTLDSVISCSRDAEIRITNPRFLDVDACIGSATIQGIAYKCGTLDEVGAREQEFLQKLNRKAKEKCEEFCRSRSKGCQASYSAALACGFSVPPREAVHVGTVIAGCHPSCEGNAFSYCSLFHGSFFRFDDRLFARFAPNCYCRR